ncbi:hypothetical protein KFU94_28060 [Chloroflexi bacterium TSY]|nr:hypothetical protein [Chloroflexi bacterium TSY]
MYSAINTTPRIGMIEVPSVGLIDQDGTNWSIFKNGRTLVSKQALLPQLQA